LAGRPGDFASPLGRELNVRYVLEGSIRRSGDRARVNTQLIDAKTNAHLWADFDRVTDDVLTLQDEVTSRIAVALDVELLDAEAAKSVKHPDAFDYILRGLAAFNKGATRENHAVRALEKAPVLDPSSPDAKGLLAEVLIARVLDQMTGLGRHPTRREQRYSREATFFAAAQGRVAGGVRLA